MSNLDRFFSLLRKRKDFRGFRISKNGLIREIGTGHCPICAVASMCKKLKGRTNFDFANVASDLDIYGSCYEIADAADVNNSYRPEIKTLRTRLKRNLGLK